MNMRIGIIGCGGIANGKHLPSLSKLEGVDIVAFCDIDIKKAEIAAENYGIPNASIYEDYKYLLQDSSIEVIHVCTPNSSHKDITVDALDTGKHVMCEKPMAKTTEDAQAMIDAAKRNNKKLTIGYQNRFRADSQYRLVPCDAR